MTVSFVVIAYNEERTIARTLASILAQQELADFEVIVVNDGSQDRTLAIVQDLADKHAQISVVNQPNRGRGAARAAGVAAARGEYIAFVDADIVLPADWLSRCLHYTADYDAIGGIAVPDGDATFVYRVCALRPKVAPQTTAITGNNGLFKRSVFGKVSYSPTKKNGEDVALGHAMQAAGIRTKTLNDLVVEHRETKSYGASLAWLLESGIGASRQFYEYHQVRLPDLAFAGFVLLLLSGVLLPFFGLPWWLSVLTVLLYITACSLMHLHGKFYLQQTPLRSLAALLINDTLITAYYIGRAIGFVTEWRR